MTKCILLMAFATILGGCAVFSPFATEFPCPAVYKGKCISVKGAYAESKSGTDGGINDPVLSDCEEDEGVPGKCAGKKSIGGKRNKSNGTTPEDPEDMNVEGRNYNAYKAGLYQRFNSLIREPVMPVVAPPKTMRVLLLPYKGQDGEFYMLRHVYFFVDEPRWILGDSIESLEIEE